MRSWLRQILQARLLERVPALLNRRLGSLDGRVKHLIEQERAALQVHFPARETGHVEQVVDQTRHVCHLAFDYILGPPRQGLRHARRSH